MLCALRTSGRIAHNAKKPYASPSTLSGHRMPATPFADNLSANARPGATPHATKRSSTAATTCSRSHAGWRCFAASRAIARARRSPRSRRESGLSRAAARRLVLTLEHLGYVQAAGREYRLTPRVLELGYGFLGARDLTDLAHPWMEQLAHQANESCSMAVLDGRDIVYVARVSVRKVMTVSLAVGARLPAYCTSMGRVLLAGLARPRASMSGSKGSKRSDTRAAPSSIRRGCVGSSRTCAATATCGSSRSSRPDSARWPCRSATVPAQVVAALNLGMPFHADARRRATQELLPALKQTAGCDRAPHAGELARARRRLTASSIQKSAQSRIFRQRAA